MIAQSTHETRRNPDATANTTTATNPNQTNPHAIKSKHETGTREEEKSVLVDNGRDLHLFLRRTNIVNVEANDGLGPFAEVGQDLATAHGEGEHRDTAQGKQDETERVKKCLGSHVCWPYPGPCIRHCCTWTHSDCLSTQFGVCHSP